MIKFDITNRFTGAVQFTSEINCSESEVRSVKIGLAVKWAIKSRADLSGADLSGADLSRANLTGADISGAILSRANLYGANLYGADLSRANLTGADLSGAILSRANLYGANLYGAILSRANLYGANLYGADLSGANLYGANLYGADISRANLTGANLYGAILSRANLYGANLYGADLSGANLYGANLYGADISRAENAERAIAQTRILPEGSLIGWKKCQDNVIVKLRIPEDSPRSHAFGRKCRAAFVDVLEVTGASEGLSHHDNGKTIYRAGERIFAPNWSDDWHQECAGGIHFYITRIEAENHS